MWQVPDVEGSIEDRCQLTRTPYGRRFISEVCSQQSILNPKGERESTDNDAELFFLWLQELNMYMQFLFELIVDRGPSIGFDVALNRYDLFHGHLFLSIDSGRLGILYVVDTWWYFIEMYIFVELRMQLFYIWQISCKGISGIW